jgi:hypothetical protein
MTTPGPDVRTAVLSVTWRSVGTHQVLAVFDDRTAWFWAMATIGPGADVVGSFRAEVPDESWSAVTALGTTVAADDSAGTDPRPGGLAIILTAGPVTRRVPLGTAEAAEVGSTVLPLVELARTTPVAAVRFGTHVVTAPTGQLLAGFTATSIGAQPVSLRLDRSAFGLALSDGDRIELPDPRVGLVDVDGSLLDGLYQPATIRPGRHGATSILLPTPPPEGPVAGTVRGWLTLAGPWAVAPTLDFEAAGPTAGTIG